MCSLRTLRVLQTFSLFFLIATPLLLRASGDNDYSLYGLTVGMSYNEVLSELKNRHPSLTLNEDSKKFWFAGGPGPTINVNAELAAVDGAAFIKMMPCVSEMIRGIREGTCIDRFVLLIDKGNSEIYKVDAAFVEDYPDNPGSSILYDIFFAHNVGNKKPFPARSFVDEKFGDSQHRDPRYYLVYFDSALGKGKITLEGTSARKAYDPVSRYAISIESVINIGKYTAHSASAERRSELEEIAREEKKRQSAPVEKSENPF